MFELLTTKLVAFVIAPIESVPSAALFDVGVKNIRSPVATAVVLMVSVPATSVPVPQAAFAAALWQTFTIPVIELDRPNDSFAVVEFIGTYFAIIIGVGLTVDPLEPVPND